MLGIKREFIEKLEAQKIERFKQLSKNNPKLSFVKNIKSLGDIRNLSPEQRNNLREEYVKHKK